MKQVTAGWRKAYVETYGCQMNASDAELMSGVLAAHGYRLVDQPESADVILVNTCAVREHAERRVLGRVAQLNKLKQDNPDVLIGVTGCLAQRMGKDLLSIAPHVELVVGPDNYRCLPETLAMLRPAVEAAQPDAYKEAARLSSSSSGHGPAPEDSPGVPGGDRVEGCEPGQAQRQGWRKPLSIERGRVALLDLDPRENYEGLQAQRVSGVSAWLPVQRGCSLRCTYCIVPYVRGSEKNREPDSILGEARRLAAEGVPEVVLLGQTVNSYSHGEWDFPRLLRAIARIDGIRRVRFISPHPVNVTPALATVMAEEAAVCKHMHLPLQAGHDGTLKRMGRGYTVADYLDKVEMLREVVPGIALSTDVIVAFPGETEDEYQATLQLLRQIGFDDAFLYKYSVREGTPAARLPAQELVSPATAQARLERIIQLQRSLQADLNRALVGSIVEVLVERTAKGAGEMLGRTESNKVVAFAGGEDLLGREVRVRLTATTGATFTGELVDRHFPEGGRA